ncbi:membrane protein [Microbispora rosea subsp. aerata]|nr:PP2C family protein-serine/threonine phosphatase [Microbispora rosea]GGO29751.1 membrane protein [Microbispora rosea subsp. aerata]GIH58956.1 membrane protein [Microbispora rosea subsp. aerata]GLJ86176.1 membrane protein [Microbispora rosea subsp. aerata]
MGTEAVLRALPFAAMGAVAVLDLLVGPSMGLLPLLTLGPAFAAVTGGVRHTALAGLVALILSVPLAYHDRLLGRTQIIITLAAIVGVTAAAMLVCRLRAEGERKLTGARLVAEAVQRVLMHPVPRRAGDLRIALSYTSAATGARIGGDLYDVARGPGGVRVIVGDVQGKGLNAVETAASVVGAFREAAYDEPTLTDVGRRLESHLGRRLGGERFVTAVLAEVCGDRISLLNYGHPPPLLLTAGGCVRRLEPPEETPPLGLVALAPAGPKPYECAFRSGDQILFYTDGVIEARDRGGAFYPLEDRAPRLLLAGDPQTSLDLLERDLVAHVGGPIPDDAAMLLVRRERA